jgi:Xaa-Pro aminopeptidase
MKFHAMYGRYNIFVQNYTIMKGNTTMETATNPSAFPRIPDSEFTLRMKIFKERMAKEKLDLVVVYSSNHIEPSSVRYLCDFSPVNENGAIVIPLDGEPIVCSGQAGHNWSTHTSRIKNIRVFPEVGEVSGVEYDIDTSDFEVLFRELKGKHSIKKIGWIGEFTFPVVIYEKLRKVFANAELVNVDSMIYAMRTSKSENELSCMRKAGEIITRSFEYAIPRIKPGVTEMDIQADLESEMLRLGAEDHCLSWAPEVGSGVVNSNLCVNRNSLRKVQAGEIIDVNAGALYEGYNGVICTPVVLGEVPKEMKSAIAVGWDAERLVADALKPGVSSRQLVKIYGDFLEKKGYRKFSPYGAVHSIGMLECEAPFFSAKRDVFLAENSTVAIDVYFAEMPWGSFRIEDTFIVKSSGTEKITHFNEKHLPRYVK